MALPRVETAKPVDLVAGALASTALVAVVLLFPESPFRVGLGLLFVLFFPGHALLHAVAPRLEGRDGRYKGFPTVTAWGVSAGLSVAVVVAVGLVLDATVGVHRATFVVALWLATLGLYAAALWQRVRADAARRPRFSLSYPAAFRPAPRQGVFTVAIVVALVGTGAALHDALQTPVGDAAFTEFYVVVPGGGSSDVDATLPPGEVARARVGVVNQEGGTHAYTLLALRAPVTYGVADTGEAVPAPGNATTLMEKEFVLGAGETWEGPVAVEAPPGGTAQVRFVLHMDGVAPEPYRELFIWLRAVPPGGSL